MKHLLALIIIALTLGVSQGSPPTLPPKQVLSSSLPNPERRFQLRMQRSLEEMTGLGGEEVNSSVVSHGRRGGFYNNSEHKLRRMSSLRDLVELNKTLSKPGNKWNGGKNSSHGKRRLMNVHHYMSIRGGGSDNKDNDSPDHNKTAVHVTTVIPVGEISELLIDDDLKAFMEEQETKLEGCHSIYCVIVSTVVGSIQNISSLLASHADLKANVTRGGDEAP